jgi:hypothetical protein
MDMNLSAEEYISYRVVDLPTGDPESPVFDAWIKAVAEDIGRSIGNEPIELRGEADLRIAMSIFLALRNRAKEIIYRPSAGVPASVVFSRLDTASVVRPRDVVAPARWTDAELDLLEKKWQADTAETFDIGLDEWWRQAQSADDPLKAFLALVNACSPKKKEVSLHGIAPILPALMALDWFLLGGSHITYEGARLV